MTVLRCLGGADCRVSYSLRRRFEQNQEDCTYTVLALLPSIREEIIDALPVEQLTEQLQQERQERLRRLGASEAASTEYPSVPPSVADEDNKSLSSSSYVHASQMASSSVEGGAPPPRSKKSKAQLWQEMKVNSITRALTLMYTISMLALLTRIQLNLLGRRTYLSSVVALASPPAAQQSSTISLENRDDDNYDNVYGNDFETNRKYLTFSWWLLHRGSKQIMERVRVAVREVFGPVNIREDMSLERLAELIMDVRKKIEGATEEDRQRTQWLTFLLPSRDEEAFVIRQATMSESEGSPSPEAGHTEDPLSSSTEEIQINGSLRRLLDETADLIDSPTFSQVLTRLLDAAYSNLVDYRIATEAFKSTGASAPGVSVQGMSAYEESRVTEITDSTCKLAHILPVFCRQAHAMVAGSGELDPAMAGAMPHEQALGNEYLAAIDQVPELGGFAAVIYSSNFEYEVVEGAGVSSEASPSPAEVSKSTASHILGPAEVPKPTATDISAPKAQVEETEAPVVVDSSLGKGELDVAAGTAQESAPSGVEQPAGGAFESAWQKALAAEDGKQAPDEG